MFFPVLCFIAGVAAMGRTKPVTRIRKFASMGPKSGIVYTVEDLPEVGSIIVRAPKQAAIAQFIRNNVKTPGAVGFTFQTGQGDERLLAVMRQDFEPPAPPATEPAGNSRARVADFYNKQAAASGSSSASAKTPS